MSELIICKKSDISHIANSVKDALKITRGLQFHEVMDNAINMIKNNTKDRTLVCSLFENGITELTDESAPNLKKINELAFIDDTMITTVRSSTLTEVGKSAFWRAANLAIFDAPNVGGKLDTYTFRLTSLGEFINYNITYIGNSAFEDTPLTKVDLYGNITYFGAWAFHGTTNLETLILRSSNGIPSLVSTNVFSDCAISNGTGYIYVPSSLIDAYKSATNWSTFSDQIRAIEDYPDITGGVN